MVKTVKWPAATQIQLEKIYQYILSDSSQNAGKIKRDILGSTRKLQKHPEMYPLGKYRRNNDGSFRAYEIHRYRISYRVTDEEIIIVRLRHARLKPNEY